MIFGASNSYSFTYGENPSQVTILNLLFYYSLSWFLVHFLNLIIAIMAGTYNERIESANKIMTRDHLRFVVDNWFLIDIAFKGKKNLKYIITAFFADEQGESNNDKKKEDHLNVSANSDQEYH